MVDLQLNASRGSFQLELECQFAAPWTVVFGPSGSGKSTLLKLIAGLEQAASGRIAVRGKYVLDTEIGLNLDPGKRLTGLVAQQPALFPHLTVFDNVAYGLSKLSRPEGRERVTAMLELVGAEHLTHRRPRELSGGEAQRVALARALAPLPGLLLLDEPLSALGATARDGVLTRLQAWLLKKQIQSILVTHDAADALSTEAEVAILEEGKLVAQGPAAVVLAAERERLMARLGHTGSPIVGRKTRRTK
jgi:ABC-type Fe3+/spermidine/putrescine transport system ATPase subunit